MLPSELTRGPWDPNAQHAGPPSALLARAIELCEPREGMRVGRMTVEILAPVPIAPLSVSASVVRPGRSVELLEAALVGPDGVAMRARALAARAWPTSRPTGSRRSRRPAGGREPPSSSLPTGRELGWHTAMEIVFARGKFLDPGPATVWMRPRVALVEGEELTRSSA